MIRHRLTAPLVLLLLALLVLAALLLLSAPASGLVPTDCTGGAVYWRT